MRSIAEVVAMKFEARELVKALFQEGVHFDTPFQGDRPALLKPGAEAFCLRFGWYPRYHYRDRDVGPDHLEVVSTCTLHNEHGEIVGQIDASCTTKEGRYCWRKDEIDQPEDHLKKKASYAAQGIVSQYDKKNSKWRYYQRVENADLADDRNSVQRMAGKRAYIAAVIQAAGLSDLFFEVKPGAKEYLEEADIQPEFAERDPGEIKREVEDVPVEPINLEDQPSIDEARLRRAALVEEHLGTTFLEMQDVLLTEEPTREDMIQLTSQYIAVLGDGDKDRCRQLLFTYSTGNIEGEKGVYASVDLGGLSKENLLATYERTEQAFDVFLDGLRPEEE